MGDLRIERVGADGADGADDGRGLRDWQYVHNLIIATDPLSAEEVRERAGRNLLDVAYSGDVLVGCMTVRPPTAEEPLPTVIARILPEHRGRGHGSRLYAHGLAQARALGAQRIRTVVLESDPQGLRFALAHGFTEVDRYVLPGDTVPFIDLEGDGGPAGAGGAFVPADFRVPDRLVGEGFRLEPLGPAHNARDLAAWSGSIAHVRATPGFEEGRWPPAEGMSAEANLADLQRHARDFAERRGFTYSVLEGGPGETEATDDAEVVGCVYIYPRTESPGRVEVSSWVRADRAHLDAPLYEAVTRWLREAWPFPAGRIDYAPR